MERGEECPVWKTGHSFSFHSGSPKRGGKGAFSMALFGNKPAESAQDKAAREARAHISQEQLERGGLPLDAERRLNELHRKSGKFFTSNLSVNEFVLAASDDVTPLGQVMGSTIYHVGWQWNPTWLGGEMTVITQAQTHARMLALSRLQQEAKLLGAHGVIGVRLIRKSQAWGQNLIEFSAQGTAVALHNEPVPALPFVCALSGQDFWTLRRAGYRPVGFAFGMCAYYHIASYANQWVTQGSGFLGGGYMNNIELTDYTQAVYTARHSAMYRMNEEASRVAAEGIVGMTIEDEIRTVEVEVNNQTRRDLFVQFTALGTAIVGKRDRWPSIDYALPLL